MTDQFLWIGAGASAPLFADSTIAVSGLFNGANKQGISYEISSQNGNITIGVDIGLLGHIDQSLIATWERGIESAWSNQYAIVAGSDTYPIQFDVRFLTDPSTGSPDWIVNVYDQGSKWKTNKWYTELPFAACNTPQNMGRAAAHEFGHYLGLYDEYPSSPGHPVVHGPFGVRDDGIMGICISQSVQDRYFGPDGFDILGYISGFTDRDIVLGRLPWTITTGRLPPGEYAPFDRAILLNAVPEPATLPLIVLLLAFVIPRRKLR